jgi:hypothetical protein
MMSKSDKGEKFRDYFITLRKFVDYYKNHFADKIIDLTKDFEYIYILAVNKNKQLFKPGKTKNIRKRLYTYATGLDVHPDIAFIMIVENKEEVEKCIKTFTKKFKQKTNKKELLKIDLNYLKSIIFDCSIINKKTNEYLKNMNNQDIYVIYDDTKTFTYINLTHDKIGSDEIIKKNTKKSNKIS